MWLIAPDQNARTKIATPKATNIPDNHFEPISISAINKIQKEKKLQPQRKPKLSELARQASDCNDCATKSDNPNRVTSNRMPGAIMGAIDRARGEGCNQFNHDK